MTSLRWTEEQLLDYQQRHDPSLQEIGKKHGLEPKERQRGKPNKTEAEYGRRLSFEFPGCEPKYEAVTLHLLNGHRYTPDWCVTLPGGQILCVEVKNGAYKHASYGRSRMAFDQARIEWPMFQWRWAEKHKDGWKES